MTEITTKIALIKRRFADHPDIISLMCHNQHKLLRTDYLHVNEGKYECSECHRVIDVQYICDTCDIPQPPAIYPKESHIPPHHLIYHVEIYDHHNELVQKCVSCCWCLEKITEVIRIFKLPLTLKTECFCKSGLKVEFKNGKPSHLVCKECGFAYNGKYKEITPK